MEAMERNGKAYGARLSDEDRIVFALPGKNLDDTCQLLGTPNNLPRKAVSVLYLVRPPVCDDA